MSETSNHRPAEPAARRAPSRREQERLDAWLDAEARLEVPAAEAALRAVLRHQPEAEPRAGFASRVMGAARQQRLVPEQAPSRRRLLVACALGAWTAVTAALLVGFFLSVPTMAASARVVRFGWDLLEGLRQTALVAVGSPGGALALAVALIACATALTWLGRLLAADTSDASTARLEAA